MELQNSDQLKNKLYLSLGVHFFILVIFASLRLIKPSSEMSDRFKIISQSVRVDMVALPKHTLKDLKKMQKTYRDPAPLEIAAPPVLNKQVESKNDSSVTFKKKGSGLKSFLNRYKSKSLSDTPTKARANKKKSQSQAFSWKVKKDLKKLVLEGNKLSSGDSFTEGTISEESEATIQKYVLGLKEKIRSRWFLPSYLMEKKDLSCKIAIFLSTEGDLIKTEFVETSGVKEFDDLALKAVVASAPYEELGGSDFIALRNGGIILAFPL